jgi:hypothetical protein
MLEPVAKTISAPTLTGAAIGELRDRIVDAFNEDDFEMFVRIHLNIQLSTDIPTKEPFRKKVFDLLEIVSKRGNAPLLLNAMLEKTNNEALHAAIQNLCPAAGKAQPSPGAQVQKLIVGVHALRKLLKKPAVHEIVVAFKEKLTELANEVDNLFNYKELHDCLHNIELYQYQYIVDLVKTFRENPLDLAELESHVDQIRDICAKARKAAESLPSTAAVRADEVRWVDTLELTVARLRSAVANLDDQLAAQAARSLARLIRQEPPRINTRLTLIADTLPLDELNQTIEKVTGAAGVSAPVLQEAQLSLRNLMPQLRGRVVEHKQWQEVENEFWGAIEFIEQATPESIEFVEQATPESIKEFNAIWPVAKSHVENLARVDSEADWAKAALSLASLIDKNVPDRIDIARPHFRRFRQTVLYHFFQVNKALRLQCEALLLIREPLWSLLNRV